MHNPTRCLVIAAFVPLTIACGSQTAPLTDAHNAAIADTTKAVLASGK
jgi:hypothetical protein